MVLKIILRQQNLDTPFIGGLGSFKLYVLVAHHVSSKNEASLAAIGLAKLNLRSLDFFPESRWNDT